MQPRNAPHEKSNPKAELSSEMKFQRAIWISLIAHALVFSAFTLRAVFYSDNMDDVPDAIRVDMVALPDKKPAELPPASAPEPPAQPEPPKPAPQPEEKPQPKIAEKKPAPVPVKPEAPKVSLEKARKDQASALKRLEALDRLERMQKNASTPKAAPSNPVMTNQSAPSTVVKGNQVSQGASLSGLQRADHASYLARVQAAMKSRWKLPQWMANANFSARVRIYVDSSGSITKRVLLRPSGNADFDERVLAAVDASSPLPNPPNDLVNVLAVDGFDADFP